MVGTIRSLQAYSLGVLEFETVKNLQSHLVRRVMEGEGASVIICEHSPIITIGRQGSYSHLDLGDPPDATRTWRLRWVNRGGGAWLHLPGQLAIYLILPMRRMRIGVGDLMRRLLQALHRTVEERELRATVPSDRSGVWVGDRPVACVGVAVSHWVSYFGGILNLNPLIRLYRQVRTGKGHPPMTSLERECRRLLRPADVKESLLRHLADQFDLELTGFHMDHPLIERRGQRRAFVAAR